jgi:cyclophilin family peptidyl-prolyl cis-trans isomerase
MTLRLNILIPAALLTAATMMAPVYAQEAAPTADAKPPVKTDVAVVTPAEYAANPEWMLALDLSTGGRVIIQLRPDIAPNHVARVKELARSGFYNGLVFHRVIDGFMAQTGDPTGTGQGGSTLPDLPAELSIYPHLRGTVSMARPADFNGANSQFFIMFQPVLKIDRQYTSFGRVVSGMQYIDAIRRGEPPANPSRIVQASVLADGKPVPAAAMLTEQAPPTAPAITADDLNAPLPPRR